MIKEMKKAAEIAAAAGDMFNQVQISVWPGGFVVSAHLRAHHGNTTLTETVFWHDIVTDPEALIAKVTHVAGVVNRWCAEKRVIRPEVVREKPRLALIERADLPVISMALVVLAFCVPLAGGWFL